MAPEDFMRQAIELSLKNVRRGKGGPFAALVVRDGRIIGQGTNQVTSQHDPTAHAEIVAIRQACASSKDFQLRGCEMYATCEPCPMCLGAIYWARLSRLYFANTKEDAAAIGFDDSRIYQQLALPAAQREIPTIQLLRAEALAAFREWGAKPDKEVY
jgi:tRNA(Arg) A34 adenosine deaminase TadA